MSGQVPSVSAPLDAERPPAVLLADPDSASRAYALEHLTPEGIAVEAVDTAEAAVAVLKTRRFDMILATLDLPSLGGVGLLSQLRADPGFETFPVAIIVHRDELSAINQAFAAGATAFVARPFHWQALAHQIRFILRAEAQAEALRIARDQARQADAFKTNMLRLLQHELRTPLASIVGFSEELVRTPSGRNVAEYAQHVVRAGRELNTQFSALFSSAQVIAGDVQWDFELIKAQDLLDAVQLGEEDLAVSRQVIVRYLLDCPSAEIDCDARFLPDAVRHLVRNAIVHGAEAGQGARVDVIATAQRAPGQPDRVVIAVRDYGDGIAAERLRHCLEPFAQGDDALTRREHGFGLGLPFARRVIEAHRGMMRIARPPEGGCLITVSLPAKLPAHQTIGQLRSA
jgi:signal transduction histidine kinase